MLVAERQGHRCPHAASSCWQRRGHGRAGLTWRRRHGPGVRTDSVDLEPAMSLEPVWLELADSVLLEPAASDRDVVP